MSNDPCIGCQSEYCWYDEKCTACYGKGKIIGIAVGLGFEGLLPAYAEQLCGACCGHGFIRCFCDWY